MNSWTSTYGLDAIRGYCRPPTTPPDQTSRFTVPTGTPCRVAKVTSPKDKRGHTTRQELHFDSYERWDRDSFAYVFRREGFLIWVGYQRVTKRW